MQKIVMWGDKVIYAPENVIEAIHCGYENVLLIHNISAEIDVDFLNTKLKQFIENEDEDYNDIDKFFESIGLDATNIKFSYSGEYEKIRDQLAFFNAKQAGQQAFNSFFFKLDDTDRFDKVIIYSYWDNEINDWNEEELDESGNKLTLEISNSNLHLYKNKYIHKIFSLDGQKVNKYLLVLESTPLDYGKILNLEELKEYMRNDLKFSQKETEEMINEIQNLR